MVKSLDTYIDKILCNIKDVTKKDWRDNYDDYDKPLTGKPFYMDGVELIYLFMALERYFEIRIHLSTEDKFRFSSIDSIARLIQERDTK